MAKVCRDVVCGGKYFFVSDKGELLCKEKEEIRVLLDNCLDFDAAMDKNGIFHIVAATKMRGLIYIKNYKEHWGKGIIEQSRDMENVFAFSSNDGIEIFYTSEKKLFRQTVDTEIHPPYMMCEVSSGDLLFVNEEKIFYVNENEKLAVKSRQGEEREICDGGGISLIFACGDVVCFKKKDELNLAEISDEIKLIRLTKRHSKDSSPPIIVPLESDMLLCWCDGNVVLSAKRSGDLWQKIEVFEPKNVSRLGVFKLDNRYNLGCMRNEQVCLLVQSR